jgi:hypothetical protein
MKSVATDRLSFITHHAHQILYWFLAELPAVGSTRAREHLSTSASLIELLDHYLPVESYANGMPAFIARWLSKADDDAKPTFAVVSPGTRYAPDADETRRVGYGF